MYPTDDYTLLTDATHEASPRSTRLRVVEGARVPWGVDACPMTGRDDTRRRRPLFYEGRASQVRKHVLRIAEWGFIKQRVPSTLPIRNQG